MIIAAWPVDASSTCDARTRERYKRPRVQHSVQHSRSRSNHSTAPTGGANAYDLVAGTGRCVAMGLRRMTSRRPCLMRALALMASILSFILVVTCIAVVLHNDLKRPPPPKNIIFMVSDGFGEAGLTLARLYKNTALFPRPRINGQPAPMVPLNLDAFATCLLYTSPSPRDS